MKSLHILFVMLVGGVSLFPVKAQETISVGTCHRIFSQVLNEERIYWVYKPETRSDEPERSYPVLYLLDGDSFFHSVVGFTQMFSASKVSSLPPCIVVAVLNTDRTRDLTPISSAARRDGTVQAGDKQEGGGAELFYRFLVEELRPEIEKQLPIDGTNYLVGHSYAGLFTLHVLLTHPEAFDTYMALDPSLWWNRGYFMKQAEEEISMSDFSGKQLYVGFATQPRPGKNLIHFPLVDSFLETIVPNMEKRHLRVISRKFPEETHGTIALPGIYDGLKSLFLISRQYQ